MATHLENWFCEEMRSVISTDLGQRGCHTRGVFEKGHTVIADRYCETLTGLRKGPRVSSSFSDNAPRCQYSFSGTARTTHQATFTFFLKEHLGGRRLPLDEEVKHPRTGVLQGGNVQDMETMPKKLSIGCNRNRMYLFYTCRCRFCNLRLSYLKVQLWSSYL